VTATARATHRRVGSRGGCATPTIRAPAIDEGASGRVGVRYVVDVDGRVPRCQVTRSSGSQTLDATTCRLIMQRYRFRPGYDARGRPFVSTIVENAIWIMEDVPEEE
jgi:protein TonB